jgi:DNA-binding transcriptional LysR family regulator
MQRLNWNDLRFVLAVARTRSLAGAARRLGVNDTTVARRIAQAEQRLGARLFERNIGILHATEAGAAVVAGAERVELEVQAVESAVSGADRLAAGSVRVTSVPIIVPRKELRAIARRIGQLDYAVYGPSRKRTEPLPWITYDDSMADLPQGRWIAERATRDREAPAQVMVNDAESILQGVKAGLGESLLPTAVGDREPGLVRHSDGPAPLSRELWLMVHPELRELVRIRVVMDWLVSVIDQIRGERPMAVE